MLVQYRRAGHLMLKATRRSFLACRWCPSIVHTRVRYEYVQLIRLIHSIHINEIVVSWFCSPSPLRFLPPFVTNWFYFLPLSSPLPRSTNNRRPKKVSIFSNRNENEITNNQQNQSNKGNQRATSNQRATTATKLIP